MALTLRHDHEHKTWLERTRGKRIKDRSMSTVLIFHWMSSVLEKLDLFRIGSLEQDYDKFSSQVHLVRAWRLRAAWKEIDENFSLPNSDISNGSCRFVNSGSCKPTDGEEEEESQHRHRADSFFVKLFDSNDSSKSVCSHRWDWSRSRSR